MQNTATPKSRFSTPAEAATAAEAATTAEAGTTGEAATAAAASPPPLPPTSTAQHDDNGRILNEEQIQFFNDNGYLVVPSVIPSDECLRYYNEIIKPALERHGGGLNEDDPKTWDTRCNSVLTKFATGDYEPHIHGPVPTGVMVRQVEEHTGHHLDPIPPQEGGLWKGIFQNETLYGLLDEIHDLRPQQSTTTTTTATTTRSKTRRWKWLHDDNVGWIHVRFPLNPPNKDASTSHPTGLPIITGDDPINSPQRERKKQAPTLPATTSTGPTLLPRKGWHVDGGHFTPHKLHSPSQSVVVLPVIRPVRNEGGGGGNTLILRHSHKCIAHILRSLASRGAHQRDLNVKYCAELSRCWPSDDIIEVAPCRAGDVLLLHPFVVHTAGVNVSGKGFRVAFNLGVRWAGSNDDDDDNDDHDDGGGGGGGGVMCPLSKGVKDTERSVLEQSIIDALGMMTPLPPPPLRSAQVLSLIPQNSVLSSLFSPENCRVIRYNREVIVSKWMEQTEVHGNREIVVRVIVQVVPTGNVGENNYASSSGDKESSGRRMMFQRVAENKVEGGSADDNIVRYGDSVVIHFGGSYDTQKSIAGDIVSDDLKESAANMNNGMECDSVQNTAEVFVVEGFCNLTGLPTLFTDEFYLVWIGDTQNRGSPPKQGNFKSNSSKKE